MSVDSRILMKLDSFFVHFRLYVIKMTVSSGYENKAYDGDNPVKVLYLYSFQRRINHQKWGRNSTISLFIQQPPLRNTEDTVSIREKVKLSRGEKWRILKNVTILSCAFMVQFTAFQVNYSLKYYFYTTDFLSFIFHLPNIEQIILFWPLIIKKKLLDIRCQFLFSKQNELQICLFGFSFIYSCESCVYIAKTQVLVWHTYLPK